MKSQKQAVIDEILLAVPDFKVGIDNAILRLSTDSLEAVKNSITNQIINGAIEYSKDHTNLSEVRTYARSMVMNHIKKAKELNGGHAYVTKTTNGEAKVARVKATKDVPDGINLEILPEDLKELAKSLV